MSFYFGDFARDDLTDTTYLNWRVFFFLATMSDFAITFA